METRSPESIRRSSNWRFALQLAAVGVGGLLAIILGIVFMSVTFGWGYAEAGPLWIAMLLGLVAFLTALYWRRLDEAAREAHKWASSWGAAAGTVLCLPLTVFELWAVPLRARLGLDDSFSTGVITLIWLQILGSLVMWGAWWLRRR